MLYQVYAATAKQCSGFMGNACCAPAGFFLLPWRRFRRWKTKKREKKTASLFDQTGVVVAVTCRPPALFPSVFFAGKLGFTHLQQVIDIPQCGRCVFALLPGMAVKNRPDGMGFNDICVIETLVPWMQ